MHFSRGKPLFEMFCFHMGIASKGAGVQRLARMVWGTFFHVCPFDQGGGLKLFGQVGNSKKHPAQLLYELFVPKWSLPLPKFSPIMTHWHAYHVVSSPLSALNC